VPESAGEGQLVGFSVRAHSTALNFQHLSAAIIIEATSSSVIMQQLIGRFLRRGQLADYMELAILAHTKPLYKKTATCYEKAETDRQKNDLQYILSATRTLAKW
jgi:superfamily II DNA or RNA helicase